MSKLTYKLVAGLGNPGPGYAQTRHNIGFLVLDALARKFNFSFDKSQFDAVYARGRISSSDVFFLKPQSYMNRSGFPIQRFAAYYKIDLEEIIVVHDDMDLSFGQIKIAKSRGPGGHNGVRSILDLFGQKDCTRIRVGVSHPGSGRDVTGHVLGKFSPDETAALDSCIDFASDACQCLLTDGLHAAMNQFNSRK